MKGASRSIMARRLLCIVDVASGMPFSTKETVASQKITNMEITVAFRARGDTNHFDPGAGNRLTRLSFGVWTDSDDIPTASVNN
jgi:hypothetical protein